MDYKKTNAAQTTITRDVQNFKEKVGNVYGALVILSKRANQINQEIKEELTAKLEEFATSHDNLEEIFENREQIEISKFYERLPKPANIAIQELIEDKIYFRKPEVDSNLI
ncbi:MAG: DNA-directed RNA polymerase subunit omega [Flavobacteriales bacterium]|jgi:DNA-directed RNA polymerase subunit K/omega|tara:strand:+ start:233 stop:565 length:333 start_codon:yes stop_codon:yes gene_type:complete